MVNDAYQRGYAWGYRDGERDQAQKTEHVQTAVLVGALTVAFSLGLFWGEVWHFLRSL